MMDDGAGDGCEESTVTEIQVEVEGEDGSKFIFTNDVKAEFGRGSGFNTDDRTVSRRHVLFQLDYTDSELPRVSFEVIGRNPIWVFINKDGALRLFRKFEKGQLEFGDRFCLSAKKPLWFRLKKEICRIDVSAIDPVKEFGFLVMGHEFDRYPKGMIRNVKDWEWFLEEDRKDSEDEEDSGKKRKMKRKRKKHNDNEDEEWTGESEDDKDLVAVIRKGKTPKYSTRSKDKNKGQNRDTKASTNSKGKKATSVNESDEEAEKEDDDDETLGGFIVSDEEDDAEEENNKDEDEEEFEEDDDEVED